jgi:hypothetical protein
MRHHLAPSRRFAVKLVASSPGWTGTVSCTGCVHLASAEALFERKAKSEETGEPYSALLLLDRQERRVLRSLGSGDPEKTAAFFGW